MTPAPTWTHLEDVLPKCYQPDAEGRALHGATSTGTWGGKLTDRKRTEFTRGEGESLFSGDRDSVWEDKNGLGLEGGDG